MRQVFRKLLTKPRGAVRRIIMERIFVTPLFERLISQYLHGRGIAYFRRWPDHRLVFTGHDVIGRFLLDQGDWQRATVVEALEAVRRAATLQRDHVAAVGVDVHQLRVEPDDADRPLLRRAHRARSVAQ